MEALAQLNASLDSRYRVERELGAGGMATVYLARDLKHDRDVAIKVLHQDLGAALGGDRFLSEIRTTARLQHPHILPLLDSGEAGGLLYYVMPFVTGETLRARLEREKLLPLDDSLLIAREVADALGYAHSLGVIHRDIKPENILLQGGHALVADFGIALAVQSAGGARLTQTGLSLGTPQYMSPEQAMGERSIDARSDIYALGAVLYEMLTGDPPFTGSTVQAIVAKVLTGRPTPPRAVRDTVPPHVESTILKALAKLPADRFATAQEFVSALAGAHSFQGVAVDARTGRSSNATRAPMLTGILAVIAVAGIATSAWLATRPTPTADGRLMRVDIRLPDSVTVYRGPSGKLAFSHDGSMLVVAGVKGTTIGLYLRRMNDPVAQLIRGSESGNSGAGPNPVFSGDGASILFTAADGQMVIPVAGGTARRIIDSATAGHWIDDNTVLFARRNGVWLGSATSRATRLVGRPDTTHGVFAVRWPHLLPGGTHALVTLSKSPILGEIDSLYLAVLSLADGKITELGMPGTAVRYLATGHIMFGRAGGELYVAPFSLSRRAITGPAVKVVDNVWQGSAGATDFAVSDDGRLAYTSGGGSEGTRELLVLDPTGAARRVPAISNNPMYPRISPNGRVVASGADGGFDGGVWIADLASGAVARVAANGEGFRPEWMRDGSRILYIRSRRGVREIVSHAWDGNGDDRVLARDSVYGIADVVPGAAHGYAVFVARNDLYVAPMDSLSAMRPLAVTPNASEGSPAVSPDGQFVAYVSNESATREVYVQQLPGPGRRVRVSVNGGIEPRWDPSGNGLYYRTASRLMHATLGPLLDVVRRDSLFVDAMDRSVGTQRQNWDVMPNGREFIMVQLRSTNTVSLVVNWRRLTEGKK